MGAFLLTAPGALVLLPLALLLAASRPARGATWGWIVLALVWSALWLFAPGPLAEQVLKGWGVVATGLFTVLALEARRPAVDAAITAVLGASLATLAWLRAFRIDLASVMADVLHTIWAQYRMLGDAAPGLRAQLSAASASATEVAVIFPAAAMLMGLAGLLIAWRWYHWLSDHPAGTAPGPVAEFTFNDHFVWLLVLGLAATVAQVSGVLPADAAWPANLLVLFGGLYVARGYAVARTMLGRWSRGPGIPVPLLLAALVFVLFLLPFALATLLGLGLADTW
ncbi:MAG TPA: DUF2232 domain-containing protein, partial [Gemmatimonadales bacterium]|nr:DUF2232 domain-containing protein [Gemmatimonadales bacterium]